MKQIKYIIGLAFMLAITAQGAWHDDLWSDVKDSGLTSATNYSFVPYYTYAKDAPQKHGGGILALYNVSEYVGLGIGVDYLGQFSLVSANVTLRIPTKPLSFIGTEWAKNVEVTPFVLAGTGKPLGGTGADNSVAVIQDAGAAIRFGHLWGGRFTLGGCYGQWSNAGAYSGERIHVFVGWSKGF